MKPATNPVVLEYLRAIAAVGGRNGTGDAKRRSVEHYRAAGRARWKKNKVKNG